MAAGVVLLAATMVWFSPQKQPAPGPAAQPQAGPMSRPGEISGAINVEVPKNLTGEAALGAVAFSENCAVCHGENAAGSKNSPPLVHVIYEANHHGDGAFFVAAKNGVRAHHWLFGDMPPVSDVTEAEIAAIDAYMRYLRQKNGIK